MHPFRCLPMALAISALLASAAAGATELPPALKLPGAGMNLAINPDTGVVAVAEPDNHLVRFYPKLASAGSIEGDTTLTTPKAPLDIVFKRFNGKSFFVTLCHDGNAALVIDATSLKSVSELQLATPEPSSLVTSLNPADPYVYYCGARGHESRLAALDLRTMKEVGPVATGGMASSVMDAALSADGATLYTRGPWSPSGFCAFSLARADAGKPPTATQLFYDHTTVPGYVPDPFGDTVAVGTKVYSRDLKNTLGSIDAPAACFLTNKPFLVGLQQSDFSPDRTAPVLSIISTNTYKTVARLSLAEPRTPQLPRRPGDPAQMERPRVTVANSHADFKSIAYRTRVVADPKSDALVLLQADTARVIPLASLNLPAEPFLQATLAGSTDLAIGKKATFRISLKDPATQLALKDAPSGMTLDGTTLSWTPGPTDIGTASASLVLSAGGIERSQALQFRITRGGIALPFAANSFDVSHDGSAAVVGLLTSRDMPSNDNSPPSTRLAIVDLKAGAITAERTIMSAASTLAIDDHFVYVALRESEAFLVLNRKDLSDAKRLFTTGTVTGFLPAKDRLAVQTSAGAVTVFQRPDFSEVTTPASNTLASRGNPGIQQVQLGAPQDLDSSLYLNRIFFDTALDKPLAALDLPGFRTARIDNAGQPFDRQLTQVSNWGVWVDYSGILHRSTGQVVAQTNSPAALVLPSHPALATLTVTNRYNGQVNISKADLALRDLVAGQPQINLPIAEDQFGTNEGMNQDPFNRLRPLQYAAGNIFVLHRKSLYAIPVPTLEPDKFPIPLHIPATQGIPILTTDKPATLSFAAAGGTAPVEYALAREIRGLDIDKSTGALTIAADALTSLALESLAAPGASMDPASYLRSVTPRFKAMTGRDPSGLPVAITLKVTARDKNLETATAERTVILEIPAARLDEARKAATPPAIADAATRPAGPRTTTVNGTSEAARIEALEKRIDALEAKIDLLTRMLGDRAR